MSTKTTSSAGQWAAEWLAGVAGGANTMSQRKLPAGENHGGGLDAIRAVAREKGVHLVLLTDDKGDELVAASTHPFKVIC